MPLLGFRLGTVYSVAVHADLLETGVPLLGFRLGTVYSVAVHADLLETGGRNRTVRALIGLRAGAERVGGSAWPRM